MDSELWLKFIGYFSDYLSALSRTLLRFALLGNPCRNIVPETVFLYASGVAELAESKQNVSLPRWLNEETLFRKKGSRMRIKKTDFVARKEFN